MMPFREDLWNLPKWICLLHWSSSAARCLSTVCGDGLGQRRILSQPYPGLMHALIFCSFVAFFIATSLVGIQMDAGLYVLKGSFYLVFELAVNAFALPFLIGLGLAAFRRYIRKPDRLNIRPVPSA